MTDMAYEESLTVSGTTCLVTGAPGGIGEAVVTGRRTADRPQQTHA